MKKRIRLIGILLAMASLVLLPACGAPAPPAGPTTDPNMIYTAAVLTVQVGLTETAAARPTNTPEPPTNTPEPTATEAPTVAPTAETQQAVPTLGSVNTVAPTQAGQRPAATTAAVGVAGDHGAWMSQSPADGTTVAGGTQFQVFWSIKNTGTTTWTKSYKLAYSGGTQLSSVKTVEVDKDVKPGEKYEFYTVGVAPTKAGKYTSYWRLYNGSGVWFYEVYVNFVVK